MSVNYPNRFDITRATNMLGNYIDFTPVERSETLNRLCKADLFFKMDSKIPEVYAFKLRGALYSLLALTPEERANGVVTHSSGNHGAAIAYAAKLLGISAHIAVPSNIPEIKRDNIERFGAHIVECAPTERDATARRLQEETGGVFIHPFDNMNVITGQATSAFEFHHQVPDLDAIIVPVGGGGLLAGTALATRALRLKTQVLAAEPEAVNDAYRSLMAGSIQSNDSANTIADGLRTKQVGTLNFPIIQKHVSKIITVTEQEILDAMELLRKELLTRIEPSSAVAYAAVEKDPEMRGKRVGVIITGGNVE